MLHVEEDVVAARAFEDVADARRRELHHEMTELELAARGTSASDALVILAALRGRSRRGARHSP